MSGSDLLPYPIDVCPLLPLLADTLDVAGCAMAACDLMTNVYYALAHWNAYLTDRNNEHIEAFMVQARRLLVREVHLSAGAGGWPVSEGSGARPWLSASMQGSAISVLVRAYQLTREEAFLQAARRAVYTFELDILDGGVSAPVGESGVFFEEVAMYPAAHVLTGHFLGLCGLYDYVALTQDSAIAVLIQRSMAALHMLLDAFDTGYWTRRDLLHQRLASRSCHALHVTLLATFARLSQCEQCATVAARWARYRPRGLHYLVASHVWTWWDDMLKARLRNLAFPAGAVHSDAFGSPSAPLRLPFGSPCPPTMPADNPRSCVCPDHGVPVSGRHARYPLQCGPGDA